MSQIIVTGASGLIGSRIVKDLASKGHSVLGTTRRDPARLEPELGAPIRRWDVMKPDVQFLSDLQPSVLVHCATANDIVSRNPAHGIELSSIGTWNVLELAKTMGIERVIFFSTFQVYGTELSGIVDESRPVSCESAYGLNHWFGEEVCQLFANKNRMKIIVVRPSNVYGAPVASSVNRETLVPACFVKSAIETGEIVLQSSGRQQRNFVSTEEVARGCEYLLQSPVSNLEVVNLCSSYSTSIVDIAHRVANNFARRFGRSIPVRVLSDVPQVGNHFEARSKISFLWNSTSQSVQCMDQEIDKLFERMTSSMQLVSAA